MKKNGLFIFLGILLVFCIYGGYKVFIINKYSFDDEKINNVVKGLKVKKEITIKSVSTNKYISYEDIRVKNIFNDFTKIDSNNMLRYELKNSNGKTKTSFSIGVLPDYITTLKSDFDVIGDTTIIPTDLNLDKYLDEHNVKTDLDLFDFLKEKQLEKRNIFNSIKSIKNDYAVIKTLSLIIPVGESITIIKGDLNGFIFNNGTIKEASILRNNKRYILSFIDSDYFSDDVILEVLNSISFV